MDSDDLKDGRDDQVETGSVPTSPQSADEGAVLDSAEIEVEAETSGLASLPKEDSETASPEPFKQSEPTDPPLPEVLGDVGSVGDAISDSLGVAAETDQEPPDDSSSSLRLDEAAGEVDLSSDFLSELEDSDEPVDVEIELPGGVSPANDNSAMGSATALGASSSRSVSVDTPASPAPAFTAETTAEVEVIADPSFATEGFASAEFSSSEEALSPPTFVGYEAPSNQLARADLQPTGDRPIEASSFERGSVRPMAPSASQDDSESFRMPPLLLEVTRADWELRMQQLVERFAARLEKLVEERIEDKFAYRDHVQAAQMRALYWRR
jgi:hypothetical protein